MSGHLTLFLTVPDSVFFAQKIRYRNKMMKHFSIYFTPVTQPKTGIGILSGNVYRNSLH